VPRGFDKAEVVQAARRVFAESGYAGATLEAIAAASGLSRVTLHRHGLSKQRLLAELADVAIDEYRDAMWTVLTSEGTGAERLARALHALCESAEKNLVVLLALQGHTDAVFHEPSGEDALTRSIFAEPLERLLRDGDADGSLRPVDALETATVLFNLVGWTYLHLRTGHRWTPERARPAVVGLALHGVLSPP
jgi:AcrR family transcriptional regulator